MDFMTNFDPFFFYRRPRARLSRWKAAYRLKSGERFGDTKGFLNRFAAHKSNYLLGFITDPATALFLIVWDISVLRTNLFAATGCYVLGLLSWTLLEYAFHRFIYHKGNTLAHKGHMMHHESPRMLLGMPWFITSGLFWLIWYVVAVRFQIHFVTSFTGGVLTGYFVYCTVHHIQHHFSIANTWFRELTKHHNIHHRLRDVNFGVTNRFWDKVFGTTYRKEEYKLKSVARGKSEELKPV